MSDSKNNKFKIPFSITLVLSISFLFLFLIPYGFSITHLLAISHRNNTITNPTPNHSNGKTVGLMNTTGENSKVVILTFGDTVKSQFITAKPILDQYGYKASFFITCGYVGQTQRMNWSDILSLQEDGQDIESKGMTRADLNNLSPGALDFEIGGSKQCLQTHGINSPNIFAVVHGSAWNNPSVINTISKYYEFADNGFANSMFLRCDGYGASKQTDCRTYDNSGMLSYANRYSIREESHNSWDARYLHNDQIIFQKFVGAVNSGINFNNKKGAVDAIPIVAYHGIDNNGDPSSTDVNLFAAEMKYLHDNGFKVIPMSDLGYDESTQSMYIKQ
ncbi:MAG: polysaccharide deacetylase family protein [Thermoproteota archaeon]|nr:polysaccharide deacetylase family protein [Thermoproteota archaeon]